MMPRHAWPLRSWGALLLVGLWAGLVFRPALPICAAGIDERCIVDLLRGAVRFGTPERTCDQWLDEVLGPDAITSAPAVVADASGTHVFARGTNGNLIALDRRAGGRSWSGTLDLG